MTCFACDIGGAFVKWALLPERGKPLRGIAPFELWRAPRTLPALLKSLAPKRPYATAITMTGELCDCFKNRREGVRHIVDAAETAFEPVTVYGVQGGLFTPAQARRRHRQIASANWSLVPRHLSLLAKNFLFVDIGSTTADLTPVRNGLIVNKGYTDHERLRHGELLYTGALRTPLAAVAPALHVLKKARVPLSAEMFAITADVHLLLKNIPPRAYLCPAPDGGPKTAAAARRRIARALLADDGELSPQELHAAAHEAAAIQRGVITEAAQKFGLPVIASGIGAFLLDEAFEKGRLARHPLSTGTAAAIDPSLALAWLLKRAL